MQEGGVGVLCFLYTWGKHWIPVDWHLVYPVAHISITELGSSVHLAHWTGWVFVLGFCFCFYLLCFSVPTPFIHPSRSGFSFLLEMQSQHANYFFLFLIGDRERGHFLLSVIVFRGYFSTVWSYTTWGSLWNCEIILLGWISPVLGQTGLTPMNFQCCL